MVTLNETMMLDLDRRDAMEMIKNDVPIIANIDNIATWVMVDCWAEFLGETKPTIPVVFKAKKIGPPLPAHIQAARNKAHRDDLLKRMMAPSGVQLVTYLSE